VNTHTGPHAHVPQIKTGTEPATYGDLVTLPGIFDANAPDGIDPATGKPRPLLWLIRDTRDLADLGRTLRTVARLVPWHPANPDSDNPAHHAPRHYGYDEPVKIGRAERVGVEISLSHARDDGGAPQLRAFAGVRGYTEPLTDAQRAALTGAAEALDGPRFHLPPLTNAEIRARALGDAEYVGECAARDVAQSRFPRLYGGATQTRDAVMAAFAEVASYPVVRASVETWLDEATAAFRAQLARGIGSLGAGGAL
jgi:hypothetical protein